MSISTTSRAPANLATLPRVEALRRSTFFVLFLFCTLSGDHVFPSPPPCVTHSLRSTSLGAVAWWSHLIVLSRDSMSVTSCFSLPTSRRMTSRAPRPMMRLTGHVRERRKKRGDLTTARPEGVWSFFITWEKQKTELPGSAENLVFVSAVHDDVDGLSISFFFFCCFRLQDYVLHFTYLHLFCHSVPIPDLRKGK